MDAYGIGLRFYRRAQRLIAPTLVYSQNLYEDALERHAAEARRWLDLGCGRQLLPPWRLEQERRIVSRPQLFVGVDYDLPSLRAHRTLTQRVRGDIRALPFRSETFDLITSNMVCEHLRDPEPMPREVFRMLSPGGAFVLHTMNRGSYAVLLARLTPGFLKRRLIRILERREEHDVFPTFYRLNSEQCIRKFSGRTGLRVEGLRFIVTHAQFAPIPPLALLELLFIRLLMQRSARRFRTNIIAVLGKPDGPAAVVSTATPDAGRGGSRTLIHRQKNEKPRWSLKDRVDREVR